MNTAERAITALREAADALDELPVSAGVRIEAVNKLRQEAARIEALAADWQRAFTETGAS